MKNLLHQQLSNEASEVKLYLHSDVKERVRIFRKHLIHNGKEHLDLFDTVFGEFWREE